MKMKRILGLVMVLMFAVLSMQAATEFVIEGVILDENAVPLIGANILIEGTTKGVVSDFDGKFAINSSTACLDLRVSYIGFETFLQETCRQTKNVIILSTGIDLKEVTITAFASEILTSCNTIFCSVLSSNVTEEAVKKETAPSIFHVSCYPIPMHEYVSVNLEKDIDKLELFDIQGQLLMTKPAMAEGISTVYIDNLPAGAYVFKFTKGKEIQTIRVSKV